MPVNYLIKSSIMSKVIVAMAMVTKSYVLYNSSCVAIVTYTNLYKIVCLWTTLLFAAIREEIQEIEEGKYNTENNVLKVNLIVCHSTSLPLVTTGTME